MKKLIAEILIASGIFSATAEARFVLETQGSFFAGGKVLEESGQTLHGDHAYVFYQIPVRAKKYPLIFLHGAGQSGKSWETTPDGRDGFQNIFLRKKFKTYIVDQPRRGRAGQSLSAGNYEPRPYEMTSFDVGRLGIYPEFFDGVQVAKDSESQNQLWRRGTPNIGNFDANVASDAMKSVFERTGDGILISHSQGGGVGWLTVIKSDKVKAVISIEPGSGFLFPEGEIPEPMPSSSPFGALSGESIPLDQFERLTKIPILLIYGDNIPIKPVDDGGRDNWRVRLAMAKLWIETINCHGGQAELISLPEIGIYGNTHSMFADLNNEQIADVMENWLDQKNLNGR